MPLTEVVRLRVEQLVQLRMEVEARIRSIDSLGHRGGPIHKESTTESGT